MFSESTIDLFANLLNQVNVPANIPDFDAVCAQISLARKELQAAIEVPVQ